MPGARCARPNSAVFSQTTVKHVLLIPAPGFGPLPFDLTSMELHMTELERDIIREILNIGLARAADSFAVVAQEKVLLEVPNLDIVSGKSVLEKVSDLQRGHVVIQSDIRGDFNGTTLMFFSGQHVQRLSRVCLRMKTSDSVDIDENAGVAAARNQ